MYIHRIIEEHALHITNETLCIGGNISMRCLLTYFTVYVLHMQPSR